MRPKEPEKGTATNRGGSAIGANVYAHVKEQILGGAFGKGDWIPIDDIASSLGVSRQPVMDAMKRLSVEGFVEIMPQVGSRVRHYSERDIRDFFALFALGEAHVARLAAERAEPEDIVNLRMISAQIGALTRLNVGSAERGRLYRNLNRMLHYEIRNVARSPAVGELVEALRDRSDFFIVSEHGSVFTDRIETAFAEHEAIIDVIEARDGDAAAEAMKRHILAVEASVLAGAPRGGARRATPAPAPKRRKPKGR